jgi:hypothetical protein
MKLIMIFAKLISVLIVCIVLLSPAIALAGTGTPSQNFPKVAGFENGLSDGWLEGSLSGLAIISNIHKNFGTMTHTGNWAAWLGGSYDDLSYIEKEVSITADKVLMEYWQWIISEDACGEDKASFLVNGKSVKRYDLCGDTDSTEWMKQTIDLRSYVGQVVTIRIQVETDGKNHSSLFIDDIQFSSAYRLLLPLLKH